MIHARVCDNLIVPALLAARRMQVLYMRASRLRTGDIEQLALGMLAGRDQLQLLDIAYNPVSHCGGCCGAPTAVTRQTHTRPNSSKSKSEGESSHPPIVSIQCQCCMQGLLPWPRAC